MKKPSNDNWKNLLKQLREDAVSALSEKDRAIFLESTSPEALIWNLFKSKSYKYSYNDYKNIFKELTKED